jgi:2''-5'' RNA ligase
MNSIPKRRTIMIFPEFENINIIDEIREKYDPLAKHVKPHVTLIFTFESTLSTIDIETHLSEVLKNIKPFKLTLHEIIKIDNPLGMYLFLNIKNGIDKIKILNKELYKGILEEFKPDWLNENTFLPHMTIGSFKSKDELDNAFKNTKFIKDNFNTIVNKISVEIIDENEDSIIEIEVDLADK